MYAHFLRVTSCLQFNIARAFYYTLNIVVAIFAFELLCAIYFCEQSQCKPNEIEIAHLQLIFLSRIREIKNNNHAPQFFYTALSGARRVIECVKSAEAELFCVSESKLKERENG